MHQSVYFRAALISFLVATGVASFIIIPHALIWVGAIVGFICLALTSRTRGVFAAIIILAGVLGVYRYQVARSDAKSLYQLAIAKSDVTIVGYVDGDAKEGSKDWSLYIRAK